jgi:Ca2+/H+ antiporter
MQRIHLPKQLVDCSMFLTFVTALTCTADSPLFQQDSVPLSLVSHLASALCLILAIATGCLCVNAQVEAHHTEEDTWTASDDDHSIMELPEAPTRATLIVMATALVGILTSIELAAAVQSLSTDAASRYNTNLLPQVLIPFVTKLLTTARIARQPRRELLRSTLMCTVGLSVFEGLVLLPVLVLVGWALQRDDVGPQLPLEQAIVLCLNWIFVRHVLQDRWMHWFKSVMLLGVYSIAALSAVDL